MNPTIYDVSRLSGVSIATVSRTFSNPDLVRENTRRKVFEAAEILHYSPNAIARAMARQRTDKVAFLICKEGATILDEFYAGICIGIMGETNRIDLELVISTAADWDLTASNAKNKQVDGVILGGNARPELVAELQSRNLAVVLVNNRMAGFDIPCVVSDEYGGVRQALEHLIARGHRNIAMLAGRFSPYILNERYRAFLEIAQSHGLSTDARQIRCATRGGQRRERLRGAPRPAGPAHRHPGRQRHAGRRRHEGRPPPGAPGAGGSGRHRRGRQQHLRPAGAGAHLRPHRLPPDGRAGRGPAPVPAGGGDGRAPGHRGAHGAAGAGLRLTGSYRYFTRLFQVCDRSRRAFPVSCGRVSPARHEEERI